MISKLRLEAEAPTLAEVIEDIELATLAAKLPADLFIHDEHYERADGPMFKGRRVYARGPKPGAAVAFPAWHNQMCAQTSAANVSITSAKAA